LAAPLAFRADAVDKSVRSSSDRRESIAAYKSILRAVLDQRPSGMRNRLAEALGKNRSFVSHITNPAYDTPIPAGHVKTIFDLCHFSTDDRRRFLDAYHEAHPNSREAELRVQKMRQIAVRLPDFGDDAVNQKVDRLIQTFTIELARTFATGRRRRTTKDGR
jgi:hypothetical protein